MVANGGALVHEAVLAREWRGKLALIGAWFDGHILQVSRDQHTATDLRRDPGLLHKGRMPVVVRKIIVQILGGVALERRAHARLERLSTYLGVRGGRDRQMRRRRARHQGDQRQWGKHAMTPITHRSPRCAAGHGDTPVPPGQWPAPGWPAAALTRRYRSVPFPGSSQSSTRGVAGRYESHRSRWA